MEASEVMETIPIEEFETGVAEPVTVMEAIAVVVLAVIVVGTDTAVSDAVSGTTIEVADPGTVAVAEPLVGIPLVVAFPPLSHALKMLNSMLRI